MQSNEFDTTIRCTVSEAPQFGHFPRVRDKYDAPSFFGLFGEAVTRSKAGNHVNQNMVWEDAYHNTNCEEYSEWKFTAQVANTRNIDEEKVKEFYSEAVESTFEVLWENGNFLGIAMGSEPETYEEARESMLMDIAADLCEHKFIWSTWFGGRVEEFVAAKVCDHFGVTEWYALTPELEARGIENPEPRGIDLYFPELGEDGVTMQVKRGDGGRPRNCEADVLARYDEEEPSISLTPL